MKKIIYFLLVSFIPSYLFIKGIEKFISINSNDLQNRILYLSVSLFWLFCVFFLLYINFFKKNKFEK